MRYAFTFLICICFSILSNAQKNIAGEVKSNGGKPLPGISIVLKDTYDGATTDSSGRFEFTTTEGGVQELSVSAIGFKTYTRVIDLKDSIPFLSIIIKEDISELKAVTISAGAFEASDKKRTTVLSSLDILTTASANADITGAIKTLPGAQQVGESEGLFVRGGTAAETKVFIDGTLVNNFFYSSVPNIAQRGRFSPSIFKGTVFSSGGYSALYGQALSSALILETVDLPETSSGNAGVSMLNLSGGYQKLAKNKKSSWGFNYGYSNLSLAFKLIKQKQSFYQIPVNHTADANFRIKTSNTGMLKYYGYFSYNKLGFRVASIDTLGYKDAFSLSNHNIYHNLSWRENMGSKWKINTGISYSNNKDDIKGELQNDENEKVSLPQLEVKNFALDNRSQYWNGKVVLEHRLHGLSAIRFGGEYNYSADNSIYTLYNGEEYPKKLKEHLKAAFAEADVYLSNNIAAKVGTRFEHSSLIQKANIAPRASLAYKLGKESQASLAYGIFYQTPERRYLPAVTNMDYTKSSHYIAQYQKMTSTITLRAEAFYKKYHRLLKTTAVNGSEVAANTNGFGDAKGFEIFWRDKKNIKNVDYWISYSYVDTKRNHLNYPYALQPGFAAKHTGSVVVKKFVANLKTQFNASYTYASGRPYYNIRFNNSSNKYSVYDSGKTIDYNSLSLSVNYLPNIFKQNSSKFTVLVLSVTNVLGSRQVYGYNYSYNGYRKEAIVPPSKSFIFLGLFISFGVDRTQDIINVNL